MRILFFILFGLISLIGSSQADSQAIVNAIKKSNGNIVVGYFNDNTEVTVLENIETGIAGKSLINNFFSNHKSSSFQIKHQGTSKLGNEYKIGDLTTSNGNFRITFFTKKTSQGMEIIQFKIEEN